MPRYLVKHESLPPAWGTFRADGAKVVFGVRASATEFSDAKSAMRALEKAAAAMWEAAVAAEAKAVVAAEAKAAKNGKPKAAKAAGGASSPVATWDSFGLPESGSKGMAPNWLLAKMGKPTTGYSEATGKFSVDTVALDSDVAAPFDLHYAKSELGWLGGPLTKSLWGRFCWHSDLSKAVAFMGPESLENAISAAPSAREVNRFVARAAFAKVDLDKRACDTASLAIASLCESRSIEKSMDTPAELHEGPSRKRKRL